MEYRQLGRSGMRVSPLCVGTMSFGNRTDEETAIQIVNEGLDAGVNFFDSADVYSRGVSEEYLGKAFVQNGRRDEAVIATKAVWKMGPGPNDWGASRYHLTRAVEASLRRLQTDSIDLFYLHVIDPTTPLDEILQTLDVLVRQGKILYVGTSKWPATLIVEFLMLAKEHGWPQVIAEQPPYNLLDRTAENMLGFMCLRHGIGLVPFSPLASGILSGKYYLGETPPEGSRFRKAELDGVRFTEAVFAALDKFRSLVEAKGCTMAEYALAWHMHQPLVTSPIVGCRTVEHLRSAVKACEIELTPEEMAQIDEIFLPGAALSNFYDQPVLSKAREVANQGNWRAHALIDGSYPPGADRRSLD